MSAPEVGSPAPDFDLPADDGSRVRLADLRGKAVVLYFYPKDATPGCTTEACDFRDRHAQLTELGAVVLGVSADSLAMHSRFRAKQGLPFLLLSDPEHAALQAYAAWGDKVLYGKQYQGILRSTYVIDRDGRIAAAWPKVRVTGHADAVLAAVQALPAAS